MNILRGAGLVAGLIGMAAHAHAADVNIRAEFTPNASNWQGYQFVNVTPATGFCQRLPELCTGNKSSQDVPITTSRVAIEVGASLRESAMIRVSTEQKEVPLVGPGGSSATLSFKLGDFAAGANVSPSADILNPEARWGGHEGLWNPSIWPYASPGCTATRWYAWTSNIFEFYWINPQGAECGKTAFLPIPSFWFSRISIAYEMSAPDPLTLANGVYTGSVNYSVGPGGEIDFGDNAQPSATELTYHFTLLVKHILNVRFPAGANRLTLYPPGGWRAWLASRQVPDKLTAHQDFEIWSSGQFKMRLNCEYSAGEGCAIENKDGDRVAVTTRVTLPSGLTGPDGLVKETPLSETTPLLIDSTHYVDNGRARLDFEVAHEGVKQMTGHAGTKYSGNVTVIWDSQI